MKQLKEWVGPLLTGLVLLLVTIQTDDTGTIRDGLDELKLKVARLETTITVGMADRFTGEQGKAMNSRLTIVEELCHGHEKRLDNIEQWCAEFRERIREK